MVNELVFTHSFTSVARRKYTETLTFRHLAEALVRDRITMWESFPPCLCFLCFHLYGYMLLFIPVALSIAPYIRVTVLRLDWLDWLLQLVKLKKFNWHVCPCTKTLSISIDCKTELVATLIIKWWTVPDLASVFVQGICSLKNYDFLYDTIFSLHVPCSLIT